MIHDELYTSSQPLSSNLPIFQDASGSPLEIFVDPGAVTGRPKLVRNLRKAGAHICVSVAQANIILVDSTTKPGRQFIRDWSRDQRKIVLEYGWARKSFDAGRALLDKDNWGECKAVDDGLQSDDSEVDEVGPKMKPLPAATGRSSRNPDRSASPKPSPSRVHRPESGRQSTSSVPHLVNDSRSSYSPPNGTSPSQQLSISQPTVPQTPLPQVQQGQMASGLPFPQPQMAYGGMIQMQQPFMNPVMQPNGSLDIMTLMEIMRHHGANSQSWFGQTFMNSSQPQFMPNNLLQPAFVPPPQQHNGLLPSTPVHNSTEPAEASSSATSTSVAPAFSTPAAISKPLPSSTRRSATSSTPPPSSHSKAKKRERSPGRAHRKNSSSTLDTPKFLPSSRYSPDDLSPSPKRHRSGSPRSPGAIFTSRLGKPLSFFVQVDLSNRLSAVSKIKKNGGRIESDNMVADYVILDPAKEKDFANLLMSTAAANKFAMRASFVHNCVEEGALLDPTDYIFEEPPNLKKKRTRMAATTPSPVKKKASKKVEENKNGSTNLTVHLTRNAIGSRSPSPPGPESRRLHSSGKYLFADEEVDYLGRYIRVLLKRDPLTSGNSIAQKMHQKIPTHSFQSWRQYLNRPAIHESLDNMRKELRPAKPEPRGEVQADSLRPVDHLETKSSKRTKDDSVPQQEPESPVIPNAVQQDLDVICQYFAFADTSGSDEEVWAELTRQFPCQSYGSWPDFYYNYANEVNAGIEHQVRKKSEEAKEALKSTMEPAPGPGG